MKKQRQKVSQHLRHGLRHHALEHLTLRVLPRTQMSSCRIAKSDPMKLKLGIMIDLTLKKKHVKKVSPCLWSGLRCLKFGWYPFCRSTTLLTTMSEFCAALKSHTLLRFFNNHAPGVLCLNKMISIAFCGAKPPQFAWSRHACFVFNHYILEMQQKV